MIYSCHIKYFLGTKIFFAVCCLAGGRGDTEQWRDGGGGAGLGWRTLGWAHWPAAALQPHHPQPLVSASILQHTTHPHQLSHEQSH